MYTVKSFAVCVSLILALGNSDVVLASCPEKVGPLNRLPGTPFYIAHDSSHKDFVNFDEARKLCEKHGMKMGKVKDMLTMSALSRSLEKVVSVKKLKDTWYWLDAVYDDASEGYKWGKDGSDGDVEYSIFLYRKYRPTGLGPNINLRGQYNIGRKEAQCITLALPWPGRDDPHRGGVEYGFQATFDERPCKSKKGRHALCQSEEKDCSFEITDPFSLAPSREIYEYFNSGNWIFGERKYIVNWEHRSYADSEMYCKSLGLELVDPAEGIHSSLIPFLKMWSRNVTVSQFWTSLTFNLQKKEIRSKKGVKLASEDPITIYARPKRSAESNTGNKKFCVSLQLSYELKSQMACINPDSTTCVWSYFAFVPSNCNNYLGVICEHPDAKSRAAPQWKATYITEPDGVDKALRETATTTFGYKENTGVLRSTYKQTFGSLVCPAGYQMITTTSPKWSGKPPVDLTQMYFYDYSETYWLVDEQGFKISHDSKCSVSRPGSKIGFQRKITKVNCTDWHFYLCEKQARPNPPANKDSSKNTHPSMVWNAKPQPRVYPIIV